MNRFARSLSASALVFGLGLALSGCSSDQPAAPPAATSGGAMSTGTPESDKMKGGAMEGDKMKGGAMEGDKMKDAPK